MSDFQLRTPSLRMPRPASLSLGNYSLQLDPRLQAEVRALVSAPPSPRLRGLFLRPDWHALRQSDLDRMLRQPPVPRPPAFTPGAGPAQPRAAEVGDLMKALMAVPAIQSGMNSVLDRAVGPLRRAAGNMTPGQTALLVTSAVAVGGSVVTAINLRNRPPSFPLSLLLNRDLPIPGVNGLYGQIRYRGGGVSWSDIGGSGVSVRGGGASVDGQFRGDFLITLDLTQWLPMLR